MNFVMHSVRQPTGEQFDIDARCRWEGEGGLQQAPYDLGTPLSGIMWPLRIGMAGLLRRMTAPCLEPLNWLLRSDGRVARDIREMFGIPHVVKTLA
jgi:hypothetical protein